MLVVPFSSSFSVLIDRSFLGSHQHFCGVPGFLPVVVLRRLLLFSLRRLPPLHLDLRFLPTDLLMPQSKLFLMPTGTRLPL
jgi:hypothetical protein